MENRFLLDIKVSQQLKLTTAVRLGLELLQLALPELEVALKREIEENPLIELEEEQDAPFPVELELPKDDFSFVFEGGNLFVAEENEPLPLPYRESVSELLKKQARVEFEGKELQFSLYLIENLDENGFYREPLDAVASRFGLSEEEA
jgi:RNA polymerase sigma-54 factor